MYITLTVEEVQDPPRSQ